MAYTTIISTLLLSEHLDDPEWVIVDCRFDIQRPMWGFEDFQRAHIPGAVFADMNKDLSAPATPTSGRHPLPAPEEFVARLSSWGIDKDKQVVVYDTSGGSTAARLWWLLKFYGHQAVAVLDGGFTRWQTESHPVRSGIERPDPAKFEGNPDPSQEIDVEGVDRIRLDPAFRLVDARAKIRFQGMQESIDPVAGHIPGAINRFYGLNLSSEGTFLPPETLRAEFSSLLGPVKPENVVVYCGSGVTSCHHLLAMEIAGLKGALLYVGSWSEWIRDPKRPRAKGSK